MEFDSGFGVSDGALRAAGARTDAEREFDRWVTWPDWAKDAVMTDVNVTLSWRDRLWVLARGRFTVTAKVFTENVVGKTDSRSRFDVNRRWPWQRRMYGMVTRAEREPERMK